MTTLPPNNSEPPTITTATVLAPPALSNLNSISPPVSAPNGFHSDISDTEAAKLAAQKGQVSFTLRKGARVGLLPGGPPPPPLAPAPSISTSTAIAPVLAPTPPPVPLYPALHLSPLNDTFVPKQISLSPIGSKVKIGRQTNAKTIPNGTNGYFDSKVLSRMHAEVWSEEDKVFIKDVKSSNGTFINGERLSQEAAESDVFELHTEDVVEFGIDIVSDDNKTIVHHKVAAKVFIVMNAEDAAFSSREFSNWYRASSESAHNRRNTKVTGSNGLSYDHVINRLQGELQKSRDAGLDLGSLSTTLNQVQDTLAGGAPPPLPPFSRIPPYQNGSKDVTANSIALLQSQLTETQLNLASHVGKISDLEGLLSEQEGIKLEVIGLRELMEDSRRDMFTLMRARENHSERENGGRESPVAALLEAQEADDEEDDTRSVSSVETVKNGGARLEREGALQEQNTRLSKRLEKLSVELEKAIELGTTLRTQHQEASSTIKILETKITSLEKAVEQVSIQHETKWNGWKEMFETSWKKERLDWQEEREKLMNVVREWDSNRESSDDSESEEGEKEEIESEGIPTESEKKKKSRRRRKGRLTKATAEALALSTRSKLPNSSPIRTKGKNLALETNLGLPAYGTAGVVLLVGIAAFTLVKLKE